MMLPQRVVLASGSPRRQELLKFVIPSFEVIPSGAPEEAEGPPANRVVELALVKARDVASRCSDALVIGADTLVALQGKVLGKPQNEAEAAAMLRLLSDKTHRVYTGLALIHEGQERTACCMTRVTFAPLTEDEISEYIATQEPMDKAGAYGIQGYGAKFIQKVNGCYFNVMGLPLRTLYEMLNEPGL